MTYVYLVIAIISEVIATSSLKASAGFTKIYPSIVVIVGYCISFLLLSLVLKTMPMGVAYAAWASLGIVFIAVFGYFFFDQKLDIYAILGMAMIIGGVLVMNVVSKSTSH
ncbi:DMT family transporter [Acerihabitans arboris]|uniref:QacE family quaternary ammonium compound efflux SMR transporter n=1 Tax=Acerihabitans arboris TaxID=2691583 RepID=A0A845SGJ2_9GAMM|nr:multidrug efflux SMR transporter [Acerihabitans arboris]NDL63980.1 QacE family quaternary ammonium compound efflux SMR transporter [Acerihabitans arboris]